MYNLFGQPLFLIHSYLSVFDRVEAGGFPGGPDSPADANAGYDLDPATSFAPLATEHAK